MLVCWVLEHVPHNVLENYIQVFFSNTRHQLNFLNDVVAKTIEHELFKPDIWILEHSIKKWVFFRPARIRIYQPLLDKPATPLVFAACKLKSRSNLETAPRAGNCLINQIKRTALLLWRGSRHESHRVLVHLGWLPLRVVLLVLLVGNSVLRPLLLLLKILWIERLLVNRLLNLMLNRLFLVNFGTDSSKEIVALQINALKWFQITSNHLLHVIYFFWVDTRTNIAGRILLTHFIYRPWLLNLSDWIREIWKSVDLNQIAVMHSKILGRLQRTSLFPTILVVNVQRPLIFILQVFTVGIRKFLLIWGELEFLCFPLGCWITPLLWAFCRHNLTL